MEPSQSGEPLLAELMAEFSRYSVADIHEVSGRPLVGMALRPVVHGAQAVGPAVTCLCPAGDNLMVHAAIELCTEGDVLVIGSTGDSDNALFGELLATQCRARGVTGTIVDGAVRDTRALRALEFPTWARAVSAHGSSKAGVGWMNVAIAIGHAVVMPGDLVLADDDGVIALPRASLSDILRRARDRKEDESIKRRAYESGSLSLDIGGLRGRLRPRLAEDVPEPTTRDS